MRSFPAKFVALAIVTLAGCVDAADGDEAHVDAVGAASSEGALSGDETSSTPFPGITLVTGTTSTPARFFVAKIDLSNAANHVTTTKAPDKRRTVSSFAEAYDCKVAVNGDFFNGEYMPLGLAVGGGEAWPGTRDPGDWGFAAFGEGRASISAPSKVVDPIPTWIEASVGGNPMVLDRGRPLEPTSCAPHFCERHPRTAVALSKDGETLYLAVIEGRTQGSLGATTYEVGALLADLGAWRGINLDGGGSSAFYLRSNGIVNRPSDGQERVVANHIGICDR